MNAGLIPHTTEAKCASQKDSCVCKLSFAHDGNHICECEGSWDEEGNVVAFPALVVEEGGMFPIGSRPFDGLGL
jgi:hypothetical protein